MNFWEQRKEALWKFKRISDPEHMDKIYHCINRFYEQEAKFEQPEVSIGSFLLDRLLGQGGSVND